MKTKEFDENNNVKVTLSKKKKIRLCNRTDFEIVNLGEQFDLKTKFVNALYCIDNYDEIEL